MTRISHAVKVLAVLLFTLVSCHSHEHPHDHGHGASHDHHDHGHDDHEETASVKVTSWTKHAELFVDFSPLIVGDETVFAAHFTDMNNFDPINGGKLTIVLKDGNNTLMRAEAMVSSSPGIYLPTITPSQAGLRDLDFIFETNAFIDTTRISGVEIFTDEEAAEAANPVVELDAHEVAFTKEQAWKIDYEISPAKVETILDVIKVGGSIRSLKGEERMITAKRSGIVTFKASKLEEGKTLSAGTSLFTISSRGLIENNLQEKIQLIKSELERATADFKRAEKLYEDKIIGLKEIEKRKSAYQVAQAKYETVNDDADKSIDYSISSPIAGIVKQILVSDGQFVREGDPLMQIAQNKFVHLVAEVPQEHQAALYKIKTASFKTPALKGIRSIAEYNGRLVSVGKTIDPNEGFIPVHFELQNKGQLIAGTFVEMYLKTNNIPNALVIPKKALLHDYDTYYVYVQTAGETFEKRIVQLGIDDGVAIEIKSGLKSGDKVVTAGAYQIKMASMSSAIPSHGHSH